MLFVCLGNICRSPLAEAAFRAAALRIGLDAEIESAGTGDWHLGHPADSRAQAVAKRAGIDLSPHRARQIEPDDFRRFDEIVALDRQNLADLKGLAPADSTARLSLLLDAVPGREGEAVRDPFYGEETGFEDTWHDVVAGADALARRLVAGDARTRSGASG